MHSCILNISYSNTNQFFDEQNLIKIGITLLIFFFFCNFLTKSNDKELVVASKILMDEDVLLVFNSLKNNSFLQKIDFYMTNYIKSNKDDK